jgi:chemotaxis protein methyltransferase CheR
MTSESGATGDVRFRGLIEDAPLLAEAIVDTVREALLLLDANLKVVLANPSFYAMFKVGPAQTLGRMVYQLGNGQWDIPRLRELLEEIIPNNNAFFDYEVAHDFPGIGRKVMLLNARKLRRRDGQEELILLAIEEITALHEHQEELRRLVQERKALVQEIHHRVKNNFHSVVTLLNMHSADTESMQARSALVDAAQRVQVMASLHERLYAAPNLGDVNVADYLRALVEDLVRLHHRPDVVFEVATEDMALDMDRAIALALIANELVVNALKYAFPAPRAGAVTVSLRYISESVARGESLDHGLAALLIQDNGVGLPSGVDVQTTESMGLKLVRLLARQLGGNIECTATNGVKWTVVFPIASPRDTETGFDRSADSGR